LRDSETILATASRLFSRNGVDTTLDEQIGPSSASPSGPLLPDWRQADTANCLLRRAYRISMDMLAQAEGLSGPRKDALASARRCPLSSPELELLRPMAGYHAMPAEAQAEVDHDAIELTNAFVRLSGRPSMMEASRYRMEAVRQAVLGQQGGFQDWMAHEPQRA
jgi:hypothetical protein